MVLPAGFQSLHQQYLRPCFQALNLSDAILSIAGGLFRKDAGEDLHLRPVYGLLSRLWPLRARDWPLPSGRSPRSRRWRRKASLRPKCRKARSSGRERSRGCRQRRFAALFRSLSAKQAVVATAEPAATANDTRTPGKRETPRLQVFLQSEPQPAAITFSRCESLPDTASAAVMRAPTAQKERNFGWLALRSRGKKLA